MFIRLRHFPKTLLLWSRYVSLESKVTGNCICGIFLRLVNSKTADLDAEMRNHHSAHQSVTRRNDSCITEVIFVRSNPVSHIQQSSAKMFMFAAKLSGKSFIIIEKSNGLKTLPWGIPLSKTYLSDSVDPTRTWNVRFFRKDLIHRNIFPVIPKEPNLNRSPSRQTRSYTFFRSRNTAYVDRLFGSAWYTPS